MNLFNRLVVTLLAAILAAGGVFVLLAASGWLTPAAFQQAPGLLPLAAFLRELPGMGAFWAAGGGVLSAVIGLAVLALEMRAGDGGRVLLIRRDNGGSVTVSLSGLRRLAEHVIGEIAGVEAVSAEARSTRRGAAFRCRVRVTPETSTPELAEEIRSRLGAAVRNHIGQPASQTRVDILAQIGAPPDGRKRVR